MKLLCSRRAVQDGEHAEGMGYASSGSDSDTEGNSQQVSIVAKIDLRRHIGFAHCHAAGVAL